MHAKVNALLESQIDQCHMQIGMSVRIDLVCCVSTDHVIENESATWMPLFPAIADPQDIVLENDNCLSLGDQVLDFSFREYAIACHFCVK